ncbi:hypothetical protein A2U01_0002082 [Trifolium medium]|uniref:Putative plant transposon protein domain-containing protein n=1 Tax=Trifolium medium TaxID=97028 RepID=A0A392M1T8_9FABA|nr:hypothetical protein [Trifolium medium]
MSSMLTRLTGKGKKKDNTPPQEPPKKKRLTRIGSSKSGVGNSSQVQQQGPLPVLAVNAQTSVPPHLQPFSHKFLREESQARKWMNFNKLMLRDEKNPGKALWVREFLANAYDPTDHAPTFKSYVRGVEIDYSADAINTLLGCKSREKCTFLDEKRRVDASLEPERTRIKDFVCRPGARWLPYSASSVPTRIRLGAFKPHARAWGEFWIKNVIMVGNSSEIQIVNVAAVKLIVEGKFIDLGIWLANDLYEMANNKNPTFTLGHCNLISALCRANKVPSGGYEDGDMHPIRALSLNYYNKKYESGVVVYPKGPSEEANAVVREEEEINMFEAGVHPNQHQVLENHPAPEAPQFTHSVNELAALLHSMELSQYSGLPNMYYDTQSAMYTEAIAYRETFPPPTFGTLYPTDPEWDAHQAR